VKFLQRCDLLFCRVLVQRMHCHCANARQVLRQSTAPDRRVRGVPTAATASRQTL